MMFSTLLALPLVLSGIKSEKLVVGYLPNWKGEPAVLDSIDFSKLTHLNIAFENPSDDEGNLTYAAENDGIIARSHAKKVKVLISIGGGGTADDAALNARYYALISDAKRAAFVAKLTDYVIRHHFDGLDVDLEGPSINEDYGKFVVDLGKSLKAKGKLLTSAVSQGFGGDKIPSDCLSTFDFVNVMAYDATGPWDPNRPGQHSSFDYAKSNMQYWLDRGLAKDKAVLGVPFYGYGFGDAAGKGDYTYRGILEAFPGSENLDQIGSTIWYNGIPTMKAKTQWVVDQGLAGVMIWSIDQDVTGPKSLLKAIRDTLNNPKKQTD